MIPIGLRNTLLVGVLMYFIVIGFFLKKKALALKYTLLWIFAGVMMAILTIWPQLLFLVTRRLGIEGNMNGLFIFALAFVLMMLMALTSIVSRQSVRIKKLIQKQALLEKQVRNLQENINKDSGNIVEEKQHKYD